MKSFLPNVEFYITNVCNFNCNNCNRFNNYAFSGGIQRWEEYKEIYTEWATKLSFSKFSILGGEPFTNPDYKLWIKNIGNLWPNAIGTVITNGHYLDPGDQELYKILLNNSNLSLSISAHSQDLIVPLINKVNQFLQHPVTLTRTPENLSKIQNFNDTWKQSYNNIRDISWPDCDTVDQWDLLPSRIKDECCNVFNFSPDIIGDKVRNYTFVDANGVKIEISVNLYFHQSSMVRSDPNTFKLHNSDPVKAHDICDSKYCHTFFNGKLYKCFLPALAPEFSKQFYVDISSDDEILLKSYKPLVHNCTNDELLDFVGSIRDIIPQCKFCPESYVNALNQGRHGKKIHIIKRKKEVNA